MTYEQLKLLRRKQGKPPMSKQEVYDEAVRQCAQAIGMSEKSLIALMSKGESK